MIRNEDLEDIIQWAESIQGAYNPINDDLLDIYEGNLKDHIEGKMQLELNPNAFQSAKQRIAPINILRRTVDKLAKVYSQGVERSATNAGDDSLVSEYEELLDLNNKMGNSDSMFNLLRSVAFEPYVKDGMPKMRVLTADQFTVWSDDSHDRTNPTVFIKFMGTRRKNITIEEETIESRVNVYTLYDKDEFIHLESDGTILRRKSHGVGRIPFTYMNVSSTRLVPKPDQDSLCMATLIPILLSDLNYASKYLSHGIRYGIDVDISNLEGNPDAFWEISSKDNGENSNPQIGVLAPSVDIDKVLNLTKEELVMYLEARSLKVGTSGKFENSASGFAKLIDSADVTDVRKENMHRFKAAEQDLWSLISVMHNLWLDNEELTDPDLVKRFSKDFAISIKYGDMAPIIDPQEKRDNIEFKLKNKLTTKERAIRDANQELTKEEQDLLIEELKNEEVSTESNQEGGDPGDDVQSDNSEGSEG